MSSRPAAGARTTRRRAAGAARSADGARRALAPRSEPERSTPAGGDVALEPDGELSAQRDAPRRRPGRARGRDDARRLQLGGRRAQAERRAAALERAARAHPRRPRSARSRSDLPAGLGACAATACCACRSSAASSRSAGRWRSAFARLRSPPTRSCRPSEGEELRAPGDPARRCGPARSSSRCCSRSCCSS